MGLGSSRAKKTDDIHRQLEALGDVRDARDADRVRVEQNRLINDLRRIAKGKR